MHHGQEVKQGKPRYQVDGASLARRIAVDLPRGTYTVTWRDSRTGLNPKMETITVKQDGGETVLTSPPYAEDIALLIRRK
jgi:hypothetical protein